MLERENGVYPVLSNGNLKSDVKECLDTKAFNDTLDMEQAMQKAKQRWLAIDMARVQGEYFSDGSKI